MTAVLPVVEELIQQLESLQQQQCLQELEPIVEIHSLLSFHGSKQAVASVTQAIDNSAARLEELRSTGQIAHFELSYQLRDWERQQLQTHGGKTLKARLKIR